MGSRSVTCHPTQVNTPRLNPSQRPVLYLPQCTPAAVLALQNWGCNASKPLWSSRLVIPTRAPHQFIKLSSVKISSRIMS